MKKYKYNGINLIKVEEGSNKCAGCIFLSRSYSYCARKNIEFNSNCKSEKIIYVIK